MVTFPGCKINLGLCVTGKRPDGYHDLETCFYPVNWCDALEAIPASSYSLQVSGADISPGPDNICTKAWQLMHDRFGIPPVSAWLHKAIPHGAGLGGGSADGASMLLMLNTMFQLGQTIPQLEALALVLGSDCPFFVNPTPRIATGKGEVFSPVNLSLKGMEIVIVKPQGSISTGEAYRHVRIGQAPMPLREVLEQLPVSEWRNNLINSFEPHAVQVLPEISQIIDSLYESGAAFASMSGSGSAVFGIFHNKPVLPSFGATCTVWSGTLG